MQNLRVEVHLRGKVFYMESKLLTEVVYGELETVSK
jgi:hypothetical protein